MKKIWYIGIALIISIVLFLLSIPLFGLFQQSGLSDVDMRVAESEGLSFVDDVGVESYYSLDYGFVQQSFISGSNDCAITKRFRADYTGGVRSDGVVLNYGAQCDVGEYVELLACVYPGSSSSCARVLDDFYLKEFSSDRLNVETFVRLSWWQSKVANKYIGYNCRSCIGDNDCLEMNNANICKNPGVQLSSSYRLDNSLVCPSNMVCWVPVDSDRDFCDVISDGGYTGCKEQGVGVCSGDDRYYCSSGNVFTAVRGGVTYYFCNFDGRALSPSFTSCPNGCKNGVCAAQVCQPDQEWCQNNNVYRCSSDGKDYSRVEQCGDSACVEESFSYSRCKTDVYFCINQGYNCYRSSSNSGDCYISEEDCLDARSFACLSSDRSVCVIRDGGCLDGELATTGTMTDDEKLAACESKVCGSEGNICCSGSGCDKGLVCVEDPSLKYADGSVVKNCVDDSDANVCEAKCDKIFGSVTDPFCYYPCKWSLWFRTQLLIIGSIVGVISALITLFLLSDYLGAPKRKKKFKPLWVYVVFPAIIVGVISFIVIYLLWWLVFLIVLLWVLIPVFVAFLKVKSGFR